MLVCCILKTALISETFLKPNCSYILMIMSSGVTNVDVTRCSKLMVSLYFFTKKSDHLFLVIVLLKLTTFLVIFTTPNLPLLHLRSNPLSSILCFSVNTAAKQFNFHLGVTPLNGVTRGGPPPLPSDATDNEQWCHQRPPRVTPSVGVLTPEGKKFCGQIYKE